MTSSLEKDLLQYGLIIGITYQFYQTVISLFPKLYPLNAFINISIMLVLVFLYVMAQKRTHVQLIAFIVHVIALAAFTYFWSVNGGLAGTVPSFLCAYVAFIVTTSHGRFLWVSLMLFGVMLLLFVKFFSVLGMESFHEPANIGQGQTAIDFVVVAGIIVVFVFYIKRKFLFYRGQVALRNQQLKQIANTLHQQNQELGVREEETRAINENLEQLVHERTLEMENKNRSLSEFAFINAHMLRGPLCRIIGLVQLMEKDPSYAPTRVQELKRITEQIDTEIGAINKLLS